MSNTTSNTSAADSVTSAFVSTTSASVSTTSTAYSSCLGLPLPALPACFDNQPYAGVDDCYKVWPGDGNSTIDVVTCKYDPDSSQSYEGVQRQNVLQCQDGQWMAGSRTGVNCKAEPRSAWRFINADSTQRGWWINELTLYSDSSCRKAISHSDMKVKFDSGPAGKSDGKAAAAFDGNAANFWAAPCVTADAFDICGCATYAGMGWSTTLQKCVPGPETSGLAQAECANRIANGGNLTGTSSGRREGCPVGSASIGVHFSGPVEIGCARIMQYDSTSVASTSIGLQVWTAEGWQNVKQWDGLTPGSWDTLKVTEGCEPVSLGYQMWTEVAGVNSPGTEGERRTVQCFGGFPSAEIRCTRGSWSEIPPLACVAPDLDGDSSYSLGTNSGANREDAEFNPYFDLAMMGVGFVSVGIALLLAFHILRFWLRRSAWTRLVKHGAPIPEEFDAEAGVPVGSKLGNQKHIGLQPAPGRQVPKTAAAVKHYSQPPKPKEKKLPVRGKGAPPAPSVPLVKDKLSVAAGVPAGSASMFGKTVIGTPVSPARAAREGPFTATPPRTASAVAPRTANTLTPPHLPGSSPAQPAASEHGGTPGMVRGARGSWRAGR